MGRLSKRKVFGIVGTIVLTVAMFILFNMYSNDQPSKVTLSLEVQSNSVDEYQVYYDLTGDKEWVENNSVKSTYTTTNKKDKLKFAIPADSKNIRIDFGNSQKDLEISQISFKKKGMISLSLSDLKSLISKSEQVEISSSENPIEVKVTGNDSYIVLKDINGEISSILTENPLLKVLMAVFSLILGFIMTNAFLELKKSLKFVKIAIDNKTLIKSLSINDFKSKYASSYLGIVWGFIQPLITICVYWFVFQVGFRSGSVGDVPFIIWFICGIIPWFFFSEALPSASNAFIEYSYLVKKVVFKIEILPAVKIVSAVFVHLFFILFLFVVMIVYKRFPDIYSLQFIYYSIAMMALVFSLSIFTSAVMLFFRDLGQIIGIIVSVGFWATPIGWSVGILPDNIARIFKLNPMYYIVTGYRDSFIDKTFVWQRPYQTIYFWLFCIVVFCLGVKIYYKLKPHFSDVL